MRKRASCLPLLIFIVFFRPPAECSAAGLFIDLPSFFSAADTARTRLIVRQAECDLAEWHASLLTGEADFRIRRRHELRISCEFPAVRRPDDFSYGVGDMLLHAVSRIRGDSSSTGGLFLRADARIPTGTKGLRPFSYASLEGGAGLEARIPLGAASARGAALYTLVGERPSEGDVTNDNYLLLAASFGVTFRPIASVSAGAFHVRFRDGRTRSLFCASVAREFSQRFVIGIEGSLETGAESDRVFDSCLSMSLSYRFPPRARPESGESKESPMQNAIPRGSYSSSL